MGAQPFQQVAYISKFQQGDTSGVSFGLYIIPLYFPVSKSYIFPLSKESFSRSRLIRLNNFMGSLFSSNRNSKEELEMALNEAKKIVSSDPVVVFSKTYCGYCARVEQLLTQLGASYKVIELDQKSDGDEIQSALAEWTGQSTVPNVFIGGKHIGGCSVVTEKHERGQLVPLLTNAGAIANNSS